MFASQARQSDLLRIVNQFIVAAVGPDAICRLTVNNHGNLKRRAPEFPGETTFDVYANVNNL
jgi:hypothetical protein